MWKVWEIPSSLATLPNACEAHLGTSRHISAYLGASRSHGQSSTGKVCEDAPDWQCGTLSRTSLRLTQHSFTCNGPRKGG